MSFCSHQSSQSRIDILITVPIGPSLVFWCSFHTAIMSLVNTMQTSPFLSFHILDIHLYTRLINYSLVTCSFWILAYLFQQISLYYKAVSIVFIYSINHINLHSIPIVRHQEKNMDDPIHPLNAHQRYLAPQIL